MKTGSNNMVGNLLEKVFVFFQCIQEKKLLKLTTWSRYVFWYNLTSARFGVYLCPNERLNNYLHWNWEQLITNENSIHGFLFGWNFGRVGYFSVHSFINLFPRNNEFCNHNRNKLNMQVIIKSHWIWPKPPVPNDVENTENSIPIHLVDICTYANWP